MLDHIRAMTFLDFDYVDRSLRFAKEFAEGGHIATLPEIVTARTKHPDTSHYLWRKAFTTATSEYYGLSRGGVPIIIVAHGVGPLADLKGIAQAYWPRLPYSLKGRGPTRWVNDYGEGRISKDESRRLENGDYGEVAVIEVSRLAGIYPDFDPWADMGQAERDPLLQARLGRDWRGALEIMFEASRQQEVLNFGPATKVVCSGGPRVYRGGLSAGGLPIAHLLLAGSSFHLTDLKSGHIGFDIDHYRRRGISTFIGVRPGGDVADTHPGPWSLDQHLNKLTAPTAAEGSRPDFFALRQIGDEWFTQVPKTGRSLDTSWPEYSVSQMETVGPAGKIVALGESRFFCYDINDVRRQAPAGANAYYVSSEPRRINVGGAAAMEADVVFCHVTLGERLTESPRTTLRRDLMTNLLLLERLEALNADR